jgi:hypothetical protein
MRGSLIRYARPTILVGPPHPVSNIRPVLYDALPHEYSASSCSSSSSPSFTDPSGTNSTIEEEGAKSSSCSSSPYAVDEFTGSSAQAGPSASLSAGGKDEWAIRWKKIENDRANHLFWLDVRLFLFLFLIFLSANLWQTSEIVILSDLRAQFPLPPHVFIE